LLNSFALSYIEFSSVGINTCCLLLLLQHVSKMSVKKVVSRKYFIGLNLMAHNVCVSAVVRFRSRVLSPKPNVERRYKLWATRHRTIAETLC
jgi:hypothetical protein